MEIKSKLPRSDFAMHVSMFREGVTESLHTVVLSFDYLIKDFRWVYDVLIRESLHAAAWEGLIEGIVHGLDGRIPLDELYDHLGPYAYVYIKSAIAKYWELRDVIRVPAQTIRDSKGTKHPVKKPTVVSIHAENIEGQTHDPVAPEVHMPDFSCSEILQLLQASDREKEILTCLRDDKTQQETADELGISRSLVAMTLMSIRERAYRIGLHNVYRS